MILAPDMLKLVACYQSYTVRYIYKHHKFDDGTFLVSFAGFEEVAIIFFFIFVIVICETEIISMEESGGLA